MLDFNTDFVREHHIVLLDCQIDIILKSLELYSYTYRFVVPHKKCEAREEDLRISLVRDTYEQILSEYSDSKKQQEMNKNEMSMKNIS